MAGNSVYTENPAFGADPDRWFRPMEVVPGRVAVDTGEYKPPADTKTITIQQKKAGEITIERERFRRAQR